MSLPVSRPRHPSLNPCATAKIYRRSISSRFSPKTCVHFLKGYNSGCMSHASRLPYCFAWPSAEVGVSDVHPRSRRRKRLLHIGKRSSRRRASSKCSLVRSGSAFAARNIANRRHHHRRRLFFFNKYTTVVVPLLCRLSSAGCPL